MTVSEIVTTAYLVRHGAIPEVVRAGWSGEAPLTRGTSVVVETSRGPELATVLELVRPNGSAPTPDPESLFPILREASEADRTTAREQTRRARDEFSKWTQRITEWNLDLQLIDLEWTLDSSRFVLYVLNERGPECTKLALQAAAAGYGVVDVQPVSSDGLVTVPVEKKGGGGCGNCGSH
ncbi:PSP1 C-terminal domain-containing protein [Planctomicrobium piriforme]|uniref:PSP1 C-terminal conserved region n=1 Tax=Planctomicrobium piriforme TaxID=1576369 RepID=A0A1I3J0Q0_9PLAN|nr:PSP1 C-terminal domain-containing protein [Planctomicrobium piriforme]SFI53837.1 PSP1 C-terminal conserved region [Planctomicrobium piriforme]